MMLTSSSIPLLSTSELSVHLMNHALFQREFLYPYLRAIWRAILAGLAFVLRDVLQRLLVCICH